jgi:NIMA (never in mitosis gene a)-related kinase
MALQERLKAELGRESSIAHELDLYAQLPRHRHLIACLGHFWKGFAADGATAGRSSVEISGRDSRSRDMVQSGKARLVLVLEHAPLGDLHEFLQTRRSAGLAGFLDEPIIWSLFAQIASAVCHLHAHSIVHRDLKALNVVLCADKTGNGGSDVAHVARREQSQQRRLHGITKSTAGDATAYRGVALRHLVAKICDLGVSRSRSDDTVYMQTFCGTPAYLAPELVGSQPYTERADVWSLGVILYELTAMRLPFHGRDLREVSELIAKGKFAPLPAGYSSTLSALIASMLQLDLAKRPSAELVVQIAREQLGGEQVTPEPQVQAEARPHSQQTQDGGRSSSECSRAERDDGGEVVSAANILELEQPTRAHCSRSGAVPSLEPTLPCATSVTTCQPSPQRPGMKEGDRGRARSGRGEALTAVVRPYNPADAPSSVPAPNAPTPARPAAASDLQRDQMAAMALAAAADMAARRAGAKASSCSREANYDRKRREFLARQQAGHAGASAVGGRSGGQSQAPCSEACRAGGGDSGDGEGASRDSAAKPTRGANAGARRSGVESGAAGRELEVWSIGETGAEVLDAGLEAFSSTSSNGSVLSARDARLAQRLRDRDACSLPSSRDSSRPPSAPGIPLERDHARALSERQAQAYVLAQQMVAMHAAEKSRQPKGVAQPKVAAPGLPSDGAMVTPNRPSSCAVATAGFPIGRLARPNSAVASRPSTGRPSSTASRAGSAAEGYDLITGAPLQSWRIR